MTGKTKSVRNAFAFATLVFASTSALSAEWCNPDQPLFGAMLYADNCASCHGSNAAGGKTPNGVVAPDLTMLARKAKGKFPALRGADIIRYGGALPDHSISSQMPVWAKIFYAECGPVYSRRVVVELMKYLQDQQK
jgi:mono/diheme cytochrome c family protein